MKVAILWGISLLVILKGMAQLPVDFRSEQIHLSVDKYSYLQGDTIFVEGRVVCLSEKQLLPYSKYLYVELFNEQDSVLLRHKLACKDNGYFHGCLATDYTWSKGVYYIRAYTRLMCNFSLESFAFQPVLLGETFPSISETTAELRCMVIPSGGNLVSGCPQSLTVYLTNEADFPVSTKLFLLEEQGDTLARIQTSLSGLAFLSFIPQLNKQYWLTAKMNGLYYRFPVPAVSDKVKIQGNLNGQRLTYQLLNERDPSDKYRLYLYDKDNGLIELTTVKLAGIVTLDYIPEVLSLFLTDQEGNIVSEYTVTGKYRSQGLLHIPKTIHVGDTLRFRLEGIPDSCKVMTKIVSKNDRLISYAESNLKFLSDYVSLLPFPSKLFAEEDDANKESDLLAWLATAHFKRFRLQDVVSLDTGIYKYLPETVMGFEGRVENKSGHSFKEGTVVAYHTETGCVYDVSLDEKGHFYLAVDDFKEGDSFFLQAINPKGKPEFADFHITKETYPKVLNPVRFRLAKSYYSETETIIGNDGIKSFYMEGSDSIRQFTLPDITVKTRLYAGEEPVETNRFYQTNYASREKIEERNFLTLYDILQDMPGVAIERYYDEQLKTFVYSLSSSRGSSTLKGNNELMILIDGYRSNENTETLMNMSASDIESVELLRPWQTLAYVTGTINGAILITTRRFKNRSNLPSKGIMYKPQGLSSEVLSERLPWVAKKKGTFRIVVDVFSENDVYSYERVFEVK